MFHCGLRRLLDPSSRLATIDMDRKFGGSAPFLGRGAEFPSNGMWPGPRPTCLPSFILIHPTVWPQYVNVADSQTGQEPFYKRSPKNRCRIEKVVLKRKLAQFLGDLFSFQRTSIVAKRSPISAIAELLLVVFHFFCCCAATAL